MKKLTGILLVFILISSVFAQETNKYNATFKWTYNEAKEDLASCFILYWRCQGENYNDERSMVIEDVSLRICYLDIDYDAEYSFRMKTCIKSLNGKPTESSSNECSIIKSSVEPPSELTVE